MEEPIYYKILYWKGQKPSGAPCSIVSPESNMQKFGFWKEIKDQVRFGKDIGWINSKKHREFKLKNGNMLWLKIQTFSDLQAESKHIFGKDWRRGFKTIGLHDSPSVL